MQKWIVTPKATPLPPPRRLPHHRRRLPRHLPLEVAVILTVTPPLLPRRAQEVVLVIRIVSTTMTQRNQPPRNVGTTATTK